MTWIDFYTKFANKLAEYYNNRGELILKLQDIYRRLELNFPRLEEGSEVYDIDPFTIFGFFNKKISNNTRIALIRELKNEFEINADIPTDFDGVPIFNNMSAVCFWRKDERGDNDIENLWQVFLSALTLADSNGESGEAEFRHYYNAASSQRGVRWNLTMGLFWIRPYYFVNLDSCNRWYMTQYAVSNMPADLLNTAGDLKDFPNAERYLEICRAVREMTEHHDIYHSIPELSSFAYEDASKAKTEVDGTWEKAVKPQKVNNEIRYWAYSPGRQAEFWEEFYHDGIMAIGWSEIGDLSEYTTRESMRQKIMETNEDRLANYKSASLATWQFVYDLKPGDVIIVKQGRSKIVGRGIVESDYIYDESREGYKNIRKVKWTHKGEWKFPGLLAMKTLTDITPYSSCVDEIKKIFEENSDVDDVDIDEPEIQNEPYDSDNFLNEVYIKEEDFRHIVALLNRKQNIILEGAPGTGKTFAAKRLAYAIMGEKNESRVQMVQFHQSYSYEDFIEGYRPNEKDNGFHREKGIFYEFCEIAKDDFENKYFFIIDEINRGNLSKIFGELLMLIENDKRGEKLPLLYSKDKFSVPKNVYIIGLMNTADRSLANIEYALRRRFAFFELTPGFNSEGFKEYQASLGSRAFDNLIERIKKLNSKILKDESLGGGYQIGHSYFCNNPSDEELIDIIDYEIAPLLKEYWFDEPEKCEFEINLLKGKEQDDY